MILRRLVAFAISISFVSQAFAAPNVRTPESMLSLVDAYISEVRSTQPGPAHLEVGRAAYLLKGVIGQVITLSPEDFNMFLFYTIERFVKEPKDRQEIYALLEQLQKTLAADLANTRQMREGPYHDIITGSYTWMGWILLTYAGFRFAAARSVRGQEFLARTQQIEVAASRNKVYRVGYRVASNPLVWSSVAGSGLGYWNYLLESHRIHRLDPLEVLKVVQAQIACHLSYQALEIQDEYESKSGNEAAIAKDGKAMLNKIQDVVDQSQLLMRQFKRLENLEINERLFQSTLKQFPESTDWVQFRNALTIAENEKDGQCRQLSMVQLKYLLEKTAGSIKEKLPEDKSGGKGN